MGARYAGTDEEFFASWSDPNLDRLAALLAERPAPRGDLAAVVAEMKDGQFHARDAERRTVAAARRAAAQQADEVARVLVRVEANRLPAPSLLAALPPVAVWSPSEGERDAGRVEAAAWWARVSRGSRGAPEARARILAEDRARRAAEDAAGAAARAVAIDRRRALVAAGQGWQRAREGALRDERRLQRERALRHEIRPAGITLERALEIAAAVLAARACPQNR